MSDVQNKKPLPYNMVRAFKVKDAFGDPRVFLNAMPKDPKGLPIEGTKVSMGVLFGTVEGVKVSRRDDNAGGYDYFYGLAGTFEAIPADPTLRNPIRTSVAWVDQAIQDGIERMLPERPDRKTGELIENPEGSAQTIDLAFEISVEANSKSSTGFVYRWTPHMELTASADPLAHLRKQLPPGLVPAAMLAITHAEMGQSDVSPGDLGDNAEEQGETARASGSGAQAHAAPKRGK